MQLPETLFTPTYWGEVTPPIDSTYQDEVITASRAVKQEAGQIMAQAVLGLLAGNPVERLAPGVAVDLRDYPAGTVMLTDSERLCPAIKELSRTPNDEDVLELAKPARTLVTHRIHTGPRFMPIYMRLTDKETDTDYARQVYLSIRVRGKNNVPHTLTLLGLPNLKKLQESGQLFAVEHHNKALPAMVGLTEASTKRSEPGVVLSRLREASICYVGNMEPAKVKRKSFLLGHSATNPTIS